MIKDRQRRRAARRIKAGDGRPLKRFRWWQPLSRALFYLDVTEDDECRVRYAVDVPYWQRLLTENGNGKAHLFRDGRYHAESTLPAIFPVPSGEIEVSATAFGLKRCHHVTADGAADRLIPDERSAEGRRARLEREHPALSRLITVLSLILLLVPIALILPQVVDSISHIPPVAERLGTFTSPVDLPLWTNIVLGLCASTASVERATRLRWNPLLDGGG